MRGSRGWVALLGHRVGGDSFFLPTDLPVVPVGLQVYGLGFAFTRGALRVSLRCTLASQQVTLAAWARRASLRSNGVETSMLSSLPDLTYGSVGCVEALPLLAFVAMK